MTVFEKNDRIGGLLRYGIPDFKLEKWLIDRRMRQMEAEGVTFRADVFIGKDPLPGHIGNTAKETVTPDELKEQFDAVVLTGGSETPRDLPVPGRELEGIYYAMEFLPQQNKVNAGDKVPGPTARQGQACGRDRRWRYGFRLRRHVEPSRRERASRSSNCCRNRRKKRTSRWCGRTGRSSCAPRPRMRKAAGATGRWRPSVFEGKNGKVEKLIAVRVEWKDGKMQEVPGSEFEMKADLVLLAMGFTQPVSPVLEAFGVDKDVRGNVRASTEGDKAYYTSVDKVFTAGDMRRGQSLVVWAIREGRQCARSVDAFLMGHSDLPR